MADPQQHDTIEQPTRDQIIAMMRGGLAHAMQRAAANYATPICWIAAVQGRPVILANGSAFMLDCGDGPFVVTARHVYQGYLRDRQTHPDAVCLLGETKFEPEAALIAEDKAYDVATFKIAIDQVAELKRYGKVALTGSQTSWPPAPPQMGRGVFFVGFPGDGRTLKPYCGGGNVEVDWLGYTALAVADGVSDANITLIFDHDRNVDIGLRPSAPPQSALGGCSGAPLLIFIERSRVFSWVLGGIIYEAGDTILKAARADCLNPDGTINRHPDPNAYR